MRKAELSKYFSRIGKKGGKKSGAARMTNLSPDQRTEIARRAAVARWATAAAKAGSKRGGKGKRG